MEEGTTGEPEMSDTQSLEGWDNGFLFHSNIEYLICIKCRCMFLS